MSLVRAILFALLLPIVAPAQSPDVFREIDGSLRLLPVSGTPPRMSPQSPVVDDWDTRFDADGLGLGFVDVNAIAVTPSRIYVGGSFERIDGIAANNVAVFDRATRTWSAIVASGINGVDGAVETIVADGETVYLGGWFSHAGVLPTGGIARFDGSDWSVLGDALDGVVSEIALFRGRPIADVAYVGGSGSELVVLDDEGRWEPLGVTSFSSIGAFAHLGDELIVGGLLLSAGDSLRASLLAWNGERWRELPVENRRGSFDYVRDLAVSPTGELFVSGNFRAELRDVVRYDGERFVAVGGGVRRGASGLQASVEALAFAPNGDLIAAGRAIDSAGDLKVMDIARWDGSAWSPVGALYYGVADIAFEGDDLLVAGTFTRAGDVEARGLARWRDGAWSALGSVGSSGGTVSEFARAPNGDIIVGGRFHSVGDVAANNVARWDGEAWHALGAGTNGEVTALHVDAQGVLHLGGSTVTHAGDAHVLGFAGWDGTTWSEHPGRWRSMNSVNAIASTSSRLFVAGSITTLDGINTAVVAWDGTQWSTVGGDFEGSVMAMLTFADDLIVAGQFGSAGSVAARNVARWDGTAWTPVGTGIEVGQDGHATSLAIWRNSLVVGVDFSPSVDRNVYQFDFDGGFWRALTGIDGMVSAIAESGGMLYLAGSFAAAGGSRNIVRYDGTTLQGVGDLDGQGLALIADRTGSLMVGGRFRTAGGVASIGIARFNGATLAVDPEAASSDARAVVSPSAFASSSRLALSHARRAHVRVTLVDALGREIRVAHDGVLDAGDVEVAIDASGVESGAYFVRMVRDGVVSTLPVRVVR